MVIAMCLLRSPAIEWPSFIEEARRCGWYDFQIYAQLQAALADADVGDDYATGVMQRFKKYVIENPHPCLS